MSLGAYQRLVGPLTLGMTVNGSGAITGTVTVVGGGSNYLVGDIIINSEITGTGVPTTGVTLTVSAVTGAGIVSGVTITAGGTGGASGTVTGVRASGTEAGFTVAADYVGHTLYEQGGNISEYPYGIDGVTGSNYPPNPANANYLRPTGNIPTVKTGRTKDTAQKKVQGRTVTNGTGTITVYAEPTIVNTYSKADANGFVAVTGTVVGNTVRAEDVNDQNRCEALGFIWAATTKVTGTREAYGYCRTKLPSEVTGASGTISAPLGYALNGGSTGINKMSTGTINALNPTTGPTGRIANCNGAGFRYDYLNDVCFDPTANASITKFGTGTVQNLFPTVTGTKFPMGAIEYAKSQCRLYGFVWNKTTNACEVDNSAGLSTKTTCLAAGYVWLAGVCMNPNLFGDGHGRISDQADSTQLVVPN